MKNVSILLFFFCLGFMSACKKKAVENKRRAAPVRTMKVKQVHTDRRARPPLAARKPFRPSHGHANGYLSGAARPVNVERAYQSLMSLPSVADKKGELSPATRSEVLKRVLVLARTGAAAQKPLWHIVSNRRLHKSLRIYASLLATLYSRFDYPMLVKMLRGKNPFVSRRAAELLGKYGGTMAKRELLAKAQEVARRHPKFARKLRKYHREAASAIPPARALKYLHSLISHENPRIFKMAATVLAADYAGKVNRELLEILKMPMVNKAVKMQVAFILVEHNKKNIRELEAFCARRHNKYLRYVSMMRLARLGAAGRALLRKFAADPGEPLKSRILALLKKK